MSKQKFCLARCLTVTALKSSAANTGSPPKRRLRLAAASIGGVLLAGTVLGGAYLYDPAIFLGGPDEPEAVSTIPPAPAANELSVDPDANANTTMDEVQTQSEIPLESNATSGAAKAPEPSRSVRTQSAPNKSVQVNRDDIVVDGETVYMGNTKIMPDGTIETPDHVIDQNGVTPRRPNTPNVNPVIPPIDMRYMTPRQRRRLIETLRRNRVTMMPSPTP